MTVEIKRAFIALSKADGKRFLVERLWPRGIRKDVLQLDGWLKDVAPSTTLRRWFNHDPAKWHEFQKRYSAELDTHHAALQTIVAAGRRGKVTLIYSAHERA